jgi:hypothetical protein
MDSHRKYFTQHGMHLNKSGKEGLAKLIATQNCRLVNSKNKDGHEIALKWKDESEEKHNTVIMHTKPKISPDQVSSSQTDTTHKESAVYRTSNRQKKVPITRNNDFLWEQ